MTTNQPIERTLEKCSIRESQQRQGSYVVLIFIAAAWQ